MKGAWTVIALIKYQHVSPTNSGFHCKDGYLMFGVLEVDCFWYTGSLFEQIILSKSLQHCLRSERLISPAVLMCKDLGDIDIFWR